MNKRACILRMVIFVYFICIYSLDCTAQLWVRDWSKCYAGSARDWVQYYDLADNPHHSAAYFGPDSSLFVATNSSSANGLFDVNNGQPDCWLVKLNPQGDTLWKRHFGASSSDYLDHVLQLPDKSLVLSGGSEFPDGFFDTIPQTSQNGFLLKLDSNGVLTKKRLVVSRDPQWIYGSELTSDNHLVFVGLGGGGTNDFQPLLGKPGTAWILKTDLNFNFIWMKRIYSFDSTLINAEYFSRVVEAKNGSGYFCGGTASTGIGGNNGVSFFIAKFSPDGQLLWKKMIGSPFWDGFGDMVQTPGGQFILTGFVAGAGGDVSQYHGGNRDIWLACLGDTGQVIWERTIGGSGSELGLDLEWDKKGRLLLAGRTNSTDGDLAGTTPLGGFDAVLFMMDSLGHILQTIRGGAAGNELWSSIAVNPVSGNLILGGSTGNATNPTWIPCTSPTDDAWITKLIIKDTVLVYNKALVSGRDFQIVPQPVQSRFSLSMFLQPHEAVLFDIRGQVVRRFTAEALQTNVYEVAGLAPGLYTLHLQMTTGPVYKRVVVE